MAKLKVEGILPCTFAVYTDETCRTLDEDGVREHIRFLLKYDIGGLVCGSHAGETPCLDSQERKTILKIAREESKGRVPVIGGVVADSTREAIQQGLEAKEAGADAVLFTPPSIPGWICSEAGAEFLVQHLLRFDQEVDIPLIIMGSPGSVFQGTYNITPKVIKEIAQRVESIVACKIVQLMDNGAFIATRRALKEARPDIACLTAGSSNLLPGLLYGADGNLSGVSSFLPAEDVAMYKAVKSGDLQTAKEIADKYFALIETIYGSAVGLPVVYFHFRYKIAAWLMGVVPRPHMRLPQVPPPLRDIEMLRDAVLRAGKQVINEPRPIEVSLT